MTPEMMRKMPRKVWRAYCKRMKALDKRDKEFPDRTTHAEKKELIAWHWEKARRYDEAAKIPIAISIVGWSVTFICLIIKLVLVVTGR